MYKLILYAWDYIHVDGDPCRSYTRIYMYLHRWADQLYAAGTNPKPPHLFIHPYFQVSAMFLDSL